MRDWASGMVAQSSAANMDDKAMVWLRNLWERGATIPGEHGNPTPVRPEWLDVEKWRRGQAKARENLFSLAYSQVISLPLVFSLDELLDPLIATGHSDTPRKAYFRYMSTMRRVRLWYSEDFWLPDSKARRCLMTVRAMHKRISNSMNGVDSSSKKHSLSSSSSLLDYQKCPYAVITRKTFLNWENSDSNYSKDSNDSILYLSQKDMAVTQVAFIGLFLLEPKKFGAHRITESELDDFVYLWRVLGWAVGIHDEFNVCFDGLSMTRDRVRAILQLCVLPRMTRVSLNWVIMSKALHDGAAIAAPGNSLLGALASLAQSVGVESKFALEAMNFKERFWINGYQFVLHIAMKYPPATIFFNQIFTLSLWISEQLARLFHPDELSQPPKLWVYFSKFFNNSPNNQGKLD